MISTFLKNEAIETIRKQTNDKFKVALSAGFFISSSAEITKDSEVMLEEIEVDGKSFFIIQDI